MPSSRLVGATAKSSSRCCMGQAHRASPRLRSDNADLPPLSRESPLEEELQKLVD
jgi:hypothetical protein